MITKLPSYSVTVSREDNLLVAVVADLPGGATDVQHFADLDTEVRDLIAGLTDADSEDFWIEWHYMQGGHEYTLALLRWQETERQ
ncbi:MAG TPA: MerR, partial [Pseudonocardiaceae bacterium]|nr:MerR [Pseudonocardiaceae bacterium]